MKRHKSEPAREIRRRLIARHDCNSSSGEVGGWRSGVQGHSWLYRKFFEKDPVSKKQNKTIHLWKKCATRMNTYETLRQINKAMSADEKRQRNSKAISKWLK